MLYKAKRILLSQNPRLGICTVCGKKGRTDMHHIEYHDDNPLRDTIELCGLCHRRVERLDKKFMLKVLDSLGIKNHKRGIKIVDFGYINKKRKIR